MTVGRCTEPCATSIRCTTSSRRTPDHDYWVLSRHADIFRRRPRPRDVLLGQGLTVNYNELELIGLQDNPPMVMQDPPVHTEFRRLVSRGFTPRQVEAVEPKVRDFVVERIERLRADGGGDIVTELFKPLPSMVVAHYLGVPEQDRDQFDGWTEAIVAANASGLSALGSVGDAVGSMMGYFFAELIERRRRDPPEDDTVSHLVAAGVGADGDIAGTLSVLAFTFTMVTGGNDTTTGMLGGSMPLLHQRPDQRRLIVEQPELIPPDTVDELLRLTSPRCRDLPEPPRATWNCTARPFRPDAKCCCCMGRRIATNANTARTPANSTSPGVRAISSPSATAHITASVPRPRACRRG